MATSELQYPTITGSVGRRIATKSRTEDGDERHWIRPIPEQARVAPAEYFCYSMPLTVVTAAADAATDGYCWLLNPVGSTVLVGITAITFLHYKTQQIQLVAPRFTVERMTFTGTASGASLAIDKHRTTDATATASARTASTGITPSSGATLTSFFPFVTLTAASNRAVGSYEETIEYSEDEAPVLAAGEGLVFRQADVGDAVNTEVRFVALGFEWTEFTDMG